MKCMLRQSNIEFQPSGSHNDITIWLFQIRISVPISVSIRKGHLAISRQCFTDRQLTSGAGLKGD
ncbi:hypothetical protein EV131_103462 [Rhizobium laguerreae]|uniref:Uncharacterized protein n=1 Tax=Rhizobium laguerreae TaxID=1076926 RepID=A0AAX2QPS1_9HYPH|nr:hypothetical protein EV131_103462 [Rhizobium laguerreae]